MADAFLSTSYVANFNDTDMDLVVSDVLDAAPVLARLAARSVRGNAFVYGKKTANPAVSFRSANDGNENTKSTLTQITATLAIIDGSFAIDQAVAQADERGVEHAVGFAAMSHLQQLFREVEEQVFNGTGNDATGFNGFADLSNLDGLADAQVVDAGGTTASTGSSVYLIRTGEPDVQLLWGQDGEISIGERQIVPWDGSSSGSFPAIYHPISGWAGLKIGSVNSVVRIANCTEDSGKELTDDLIAQALAIFPAGLGPNVIAMNRRSHRQLQQGRTATNPTGAPAPFPSESFGVPIEVTDSIGSTETLLV